MGQHRFAGERMQADVEHYCAFGEHRTASEADLRTVSWLKVRLRELGFETLRQPFPVSQFFVRRTGLRVAGEGVSGFPLWFPTATDLGGLTAPLSAFPGRSFQPGDVALVRLDPHHGGAILGEHEDLIFDAAEEGAAAVVAVSSHPTGEIVAINAGGVPAPWPLPVILVGEKHAGRLEDAAAAGHEADVLVDGEWRHASAKNIVGWRDADGPRLVVSTPVSGWFRCGGERGPGVALWLALAEWASARGLSCMFVGTSGHELGGLGMRAFIKEHAPEPSEVDVWVHLGAGVATWDGRETDSGWERATGANPQRMLMASDDLAEVVAPAFAEHPGLERATSTDPVGEMALILADDYRAFGIAGASRHHHTPADGPEMTGPELLKPMALTLAAAIEAALE